MPNVNHASQDLQTPIVDPAEVSVIVRSTDRPSLPATLDSIAAQQGAQLEVVVVNALGPAHRPLGERCGSFSLRMTAATAGQALARAAAANVGLAAARAPMVIFLDDDDVFLPDHVRKLVTALQQHPDAVAAHTDVELGQAGPRGWQAMHRFDSEFDALRLRYENFLPIHSVLIHRALSGPVAACRFDEGFDLFEDWDFWLQLSALGRFVHVPGVSARYVSGGEGASGVFAESAAASETRSRLFDKWRLRASAADHEALLQRAQSDHRDLGQARAQLAQARDEATGLRTIVDAREADIEALQVRATQLDAMLAARDAEIANLQSLLAARQLELGNVQLHAHGLQHMLAEREREIGDALRHSAGLTSILKARDDELAAVNAELGRLRAESPLQALRRTVRNKAT